MLVSLLSSLAVYAVVGMLGVDAQLTVVEPSAAHWWVANSQNTLRWTGSTPNEFSVFINHPDPTVLTSKLALISVQPLYEYSKTITPQGLKPASGYVMELTSTLNSTQVYASSASFEIRAAGSPYPPQTTPAPSASGTNANSAVSASGGASATVTASRTSNGHTQHMRFQLSGSHIAGILAAGLLCEGLASLTFAKVEEGDEEGWIPLAGARPKTRKRKSFVVGPARSSITN